MLNVECAGFVESGSKLVTATQPRTILFGHLCMIVGNVASLRTWKICNTTEETAICIMREREGEKGKEQADVVKGDAAAAQQEKLQES